MEITDLLTVDGVVCNLHATSKKHALQELAQRAAEATGLHERAIFDVLMERERLGTTGVGKERPVDLIFLLLAPETAGADHLKALARVSRLLRDKTVCEKLRGTDDPEALYAVLTESATSRAA
jgi:PTS system nitrogen regulatory IIA component